MTMRDLRSVRRERERLLSAAREFQIERTVPLGGSARLLAVAATVDALRAARAGGTSEARMGFGSDDQRGLEELLAGTELERALARSGVGGFAPGQSTEEATRAVLYAVRGAAGEHWVMERLVNGELPVPQGADRVELIDFHEPGMDLTFYSSATELVSANVKIAQDAIVVMRHIERYPDMAVVYASSDAAASAARAGHRVIGADAAPFTLDGSPVIVDIGRSSFDFDDEITTTLDAVVGSDISVEGVSGAIASDLLGVVPWLSIALITARSTRRARSGAPLRVVVREAGTDGITAGAGLGAGSVVSSLGASTPFTAASSFLATIAVGSLRLTRQRLKQTGDEELATRVAETRRTLTSRSTRLGP